jgi:hypothetical protein
MGLIDQIFGRRFAAIDNAHGASGSDTIFQYRRDGDLIAGEHAGGSIRHEQIVGHLVGPVGIGAAR